MAKLKHPNNASAVNQKENNNQKIHLLQDQNEGNLQHQPAEYRERQNHHRRREKRILQEWWRIMVHNKLDLYTMKELSFPLIKKPNIPNEIHIMAVTDSVNKIMVLNVICPGF